MGRLSGGFDGEFEANGSGDDDERGEARIPAKRQGPIQPFALNAGGFAVSEAVRSLVVCRHGLPCDARQSRRRLDCR